MDTALDADPTAFSDYERQLVDAVREHGWFCPSVFADEDGPAFAYSVGFWKSLGKPEVIVFGLPTKVGHAVLWQVYRLFEAGLGPPVGEPIDGLLQGYPAYLMPADEKADDFLLSANWFYGGTDYPRLQLVWPDSNGLFPWQAGAEPTFVADQPDLSDATWPVLTRPS